MRTWGRVLSDTLCGGCSSFLKPNAPAIFIKLDGVKRQLVRGECCAGSAPPDLPHNPPTRSTSAMVPIKKVANSHFNGKIWKRG